MRKKMVTARVLCAVMAATLALSPAITVMGASAESLYGISAEAGLEEDAETDPENTEDEDETESKVNADESALDDASTGAQTEDDSAAPGSEEGASDEITEDDAAESELAEDEVSDVEAEDATLASDEEKVSDNIKLLGKATAPDEFPGATAKGEPCSMGTNVEGQLYTWTAADGDHLGLYVYSALSSGINISGKASSAFSDDYAYITDLVIAEGIQTIGNNAFGGCINLKEITLPLSVQTIGEQVFWNCSSLESVLIPKNVKSMGKDIFGKCTNLSTVTFEEGMTVIPTNALRINAYGSVGYVTEVNIPSTVTTIGAYAFCDHASISSINFAGDKLTIIKEYAFADTSIEHIDLADGVTTIENNAFGGCSSLKEIDLPSSLQTIGEQTFWSCSSLESILIPKNVKSMGKDIFGKCTNLTTVTFEEGMTEIPANALRINAYGSKGYVMEVYIPSSATTIGAEAFHGQELMTTVSLPSALKSVGKNAFSGTTALREVYYAGNDASRKKISIESGNDQLINAEWKYLKGVTGVSLDRTSAVFFIEDIRPNQTLDFFATVLPADASRLEVSVENTNTAGNAVKRVSVGPANNNVWPITVTLTGEEGRSAVTVTTKDGGHTATFSIVVKQKETARTPVFYLNGRRVIGNVDMTTGDRLSIGGLTTGAQAYWGTTEAGCDTRYVDALVGGDEIQTATTIYAISKKYDLKDSATASIEVNYTAADIWGDVTAEDRDGLIEVPEGVWIPEHFLTDETLVYTGSKVVLKNFNVYYGNKLLSGKTDYSVSYKNNINAADKNSENAPTVTVTLKGNYAKTTTDIGFTIRTQTISDESASITVVTTAESRDKAGNLKTMTPDPKLKVAGRTLKLGTDYEITYYKIGVDGIFYNISEEGVYDIKVKGIGNYEGNATFYEAVQVTGANSIKISTLTLSKTANKQIPLDWTGDQNIFAQDITAKYKGSDVPDYAFDLLMPPIDKAGKYTVTVVGTGMPFEIDGKTYYIIGSKNLTFTVSGSAVMKSVQITMPTTQVTYSPEGNRIDDYVLKYNGKDLVEEKDFSVTFKNDTKAGTATITYTGLGAFTGSVNKTYKINKADISGVKVLDAAMAEWNDATESYCYTKGGTKPVVTLEGIPAVNYSVTYSNNKAKAAYTAGAKKNPTIKLTGKGNYTGSKTVYFSITESNIGDLDMTVNDILKSTSPKKYAQTPVILDSNAAKLAAGTDFDKAYDYTYACDTIIIRKIGSGKNAVTNVEFMTAGDKVEDVDIIPAGTMIKMTVTGKGNYTGSISEIYTIADAKISDLKFAIKYEAGKSGFAYTGNEIRPGKSMISVKGKDGIEKDNGGDFYDIVSYKNNVNKGTATITVKGKNGYVGTANITFKIVAK